jgi:hypothetical protein
MRTETVLAPYCINNLANPVTVNPVMEYGQLLHKVNSIDGLSKSTGVI